MLHIKRTISSHFLKPCCATNSFITKRFFTEEQKAIVKSTAPVLEKHGIAITTHFYKRMLSHHPELKNIFNTAHQETGAQPTALAHSVWLYAHNIDNLEALKPAVARIGHKHASLNIQPDQYSIVGSNLLVAIKEVLGAAATDEIMNAWEAAYGHLANIFIDYETNLKKESASKLGGWTGFKKFRVTKEVRESDEIMSFYLEPVEDKAPLPSFQPGQYVTIKKFIPELGIEQPRQYSLSGHPNSKYYRISVKRELHTDGRPAGRISNFLHTAVPEGTELDVSMPYGDFFLDDTDTSPVVLISGGVGLTPMLSMLGTIIAQHKSRQVVFLHAARNARVHAMKDYLSQLVKENLNVSKIVYYERAKETDIQGKDYDYPGRIDLSSIKDKVILPDACYYVCGPKEFMDVQKKSLINLGVPESKIHMEVFGSS